MPPGLTADDPLVRMLAAPLGAGTHPAQLSTSLQLHHKQRWAAAVTEMTLLHFIPFRDQSGTRTPDPLLVGQLLYR